MSSSRQPGRALATVRSVAQGEVIGLLTENGSHTWRGLPFAASTAGENRWRTPQPAPDWDGRREAVQFAERCAQMTTRGDKEEGLKPGLVVGSEDCLSLDICAPADAEAANDGGVGITTGTDDIAQVGADLARDTGIDAEQRYRIVAEMRSWYFARPVREQLASTTGCGRSTALGDRGHQP